MKRKLPFSTTFWGAVLVLFIAGVATEMASRLLPSERQAEQEGPRTVVVSEPVPSIDATAATSTAGSPSIPSGPSPGESKTATDETVAARRRPDQIKPVSENSGVVATTNRLELVRLADGQAVRLRVFPGSASASFDRMGGIAFATVIVAPSDGAIVREPVYAAGRTIMIHAGGHSFRGIVVTIDFSSKVLSLQITEE